MIGIVAAALATGIATKLVDIIERSERPTVRGAAILLGAVYGALIAYVISVSADVAPLWLGVAFGVILAGKTDTPQHVAGLIALALALLVLEVPAFSLPLTAIFALVAVADEKLSDLVHRWRMRGLLPKLMALRPTVEICALGVSLATGSWIVFAAILAFDIGYVGMSVFER
ncbi:hypothetical protein JXB02_02455 [Candidatus Woesearchaeota archaeon]|nr:hypothetical protein [Candidatus Woesearchaeota archaeon]